MDGLGTAFSPETENHCLLELSNQYLINQLENQTHSATVVDNSAVHQYLIYFLHGILTSDFFEYNARPYQHYAIWAAENLADFAGDQDVRSAAQMVLDWAAAKFVVSSSLLRRSDPFRRRGDHDTDFMVGDGEVVQANSTGLIRINDLTTQASCTLDIQNRAQPIATGCGVSCSPKCSNGFPCAVGGDCLSANCVQGVCQGPS